MFLTSPVADRANTLTDLLLEGIQYPLLLAERGVVVAANTRACELCERTPESFVGSSLGSAIDILYQSAEAQPARIPADTDVQLQTVAIDGRSFQVAVMRVPTELTEAEWMLRGALEKSVDAFWIACADGRILDFSSSYPALTGYAVADLRTMAIAEVDPLHAGPEIGARIAALHTNGFDQFQISHGILGSDELLDLDIRLLLLPGTGGHILGSIRRLTAAPSAGAQAAARLRRSLELIEECVRTAQAAPSRQELLGAVCRQIVDTGGYRMAWVGIPDPDSSGKVQVEASYGQGLEYLLDLQLDIEDTLLSGKDPSPERTAVYNDFESAEFAPWRERAIRCGFASALSLPVHADSRIEATLNVYASQPGAFDDDDLRVLAHVGQALELGLDVQRKRAMKKAMERNANAWDDSFRAAFENSLNGMVVYDLAGKILDANAGFCNGLGYTRQELVGAYLDQIVAPDRAAELAAHLEAIRNDGFAVFETVHVARDESQHTVEVSCRTYTYGEDEIVLAIARDVMQPVNPADSPLHLALEASQTGLFDWDLATNKVSYSTAWKTQLGYKEEEISDDFAEWELRVHPDDAGSLIEGLKTYLKKPQSGYESEFRMRHKGGGYRWMLARGAVLFAEDGTPRRMLGCHVDITQRRQALQYAHQSQKLETIGRLAGAVGSDFERLLTIINGYADLLLPEVYENDPLKPRLRAIREAGEKATTLAGQLLGLSNQQAIAPRTLDLNTVVINLYETLRRLIGNDVELRTQLSPATPYLKADPRQLTQLLLNLALNARDAMPQGGTLTIAIQTLDAFPPNLPGNPISGPCIRLTISDTGTGMDEETQVRIFDPYFAATPEARENKGLGLATALSIVKRHGGTIAVSSDAGTGNSFQVFFPAPGPEAETKVPDAADAVLPLSTGTILLIEHDADLRTFAKDTLEHAGYQIRESANAGEALLIWERESDRIDLILTAAQLPVITGPDLIDRLLRVRPDAKSLLLPTPLTPTALVNAVSTVLTPAG